MGSIVDYTDFETVTPTEHNKAVGAVGTDNYAYCRPCIRRLGKRWETMKYITASKAKTHIYNCAECGRQITKKRAGE
jgi:hypothetical protein